MVYEYNNGQYVNHRENYLKHKEREDCESHAFFVWYLAAAVIGFCVSPVIGGVVLIILGAMLMAK